MSMCCMATTCWADSCSALHTTPPQRPKIQARDWGQCEQIRSMDVPCLSCAIFSCRCAGWAACLVLLVALTLKGRHKPFNQGATQAGIQFVPAAAPDRVLRARYEKQCTFAAWTVLGL